MTHSECTLAIVGAIDVPHYAAESIIRTAILEHKPKMIVSGGMAGVQTYAREIAGEMGVPVTEFIPVVTDWDEPPTKPETDIEASPNVLRIVGGGYRQRNEAMAQACDCLILIDSRSFGSSSGSWTATFAESIGKRVIRHMVG